MAALKEVQLKIGGVKKTRQITSAMKMVATSRLRGAQINMENFRPYALKYAEVLGSLAERVSGEASPLLMPKDEVKKINLVLCTSDRGLCGGFNVNLIHQAEKFINDKLGQNVEVSCTCFGKRGCDWSKKNKIPLDSKYIGVVGTKVGFNVALNAGRKLIDDFLSGVYDEVYVLYSEFVSMGKQVPVIKQLLPIPAIKKEESDENDEKSFLAEHICEPSPNAVLNEMLPRNIYIQLFSALLETSTSEHAARMSAMDNATKACNDMIDNLVMLFNKVRQASITNELMDIVGGAEAIKG